MVSTLSLRRDARPPAQPSDTLIPGVWRARRWVVQHSDGVKQQSAGLEQHGARMLIPGELIQQAPSHVPNPIPKDQRAGSVQDQVIRAPENCKAIPPSTEQLFAFSDAIGAGGFLCRPPGPKGCVDVWWEKVRKESIYSMRVTTMPEPIGRETPISFSGNMGHLQFIFCLESDVSRKAVVGLKPPHTVIRLPREPPE